MKTPLKGTLRTNRMDSRFGCEVLKVTGHKIGKKRQHGKQKKRERRRKQHKEKWRKSEKNIQQEIDSLTNHFSERFTEEDFVFR